MNDSVRERIARNNRTFREANEQINAKAREYDAPLDRVPFLCECPTPDCRSILRLTLAEYSDVRSNPSHFLAAPGHEAADAPVGHVVDRHDGYVIIEKDEGNGAG
jgi:hypothetical protein